MNDTLEQVEALESVLAQIQAMADKAIADIHALYPRSPTKTHALEALEQILATARR